MNIGSKVFVSSGRLFGKVKDLGEIDSLIPASGKICATFKKGHGDDFRQDSFLFDPSELSEIRN